MKTAPKNEDDGGERVICTWACKCPVRGFAAFAEAGVAGDISARSRCLLFFSVPRHSLPVVVFTGSAFCESPADDSWRI